MVRERPIYYGWVLVWALGITTIVSYGTTQYLFGVLLVPIQQETGWSRGLLSGAYSAGYLVAGLIGLLVGRLVDRHGARLLMTFGSALAGLSLIGLGSIQHVWQFFLLWSGGLGLAMALTFYPVTFTVIANWFSRRRGAALALLTLLGGLASPIFIPLAGLLVPNLGWRGTVVALGLAQLLIAVSVHAVLLRRRPEDMGLMPDGIAAPAALVSEEGGGISLRGALGRLAFWTLAASSSLGLLAGSGVGTHQVAYVIGRGYDPVVAATLAGMVGLVSLPGRYVLNILSDLLAPQRLLLLSIAIQAVGVIILLLATSTAWLIAFVLVYGLPFGAISPLRASVLAEHFGRRAYGSITAAQGVLVALAASIGPLAMGWLYDRFHDYQLAFGLAATSFVIAAIAMAVTPPPPRRHQDLAARPGLSWRP